MIRSTPERMPFSMPAQFFLYLGGFAWIYALIAAFSAATGQRFELEGGVPLPTRWLDVGVLVIAGGLLNRLGANWDVAAFVALRQRKPWLVPTLGVLVAFPLLVVVLFLLVR